MSFECLLHEDVQIRTKKAVAKLQQDFIAYDEKYYKSKLYLKKGYHACKKYTRRVLTIYGLVEIERRYFYNRKTNDGYFAVDQFFNVAKHRRIGGDIRREIYNRFPEETAKSIAESLGISRQTVYDVMLDLGNKNIQYNIKPNNEIKTVYIQADEAHLSLQKSKDKKNEQARMIIVYDGRKKICEGKYELQNKHYFLCSMYDSFEEMWHKVQEYIDLKYPKHNKIYLGSDGGGWIKKAREVLHSDKLVYIYDKFHYEQALKRVFGNFKTISKMFINIAKDYVEHNNKKAFQDLVLVWKKDYIVDKHLGKLNYRMENYRKILNQWEEIQQNFMLTDYYGTSAEGHVSHYLAKYYSSRPKAFSKRRFKRYLKVREYQLNGIDYEVYNKAQQVVGIDNFYVEDMYSDFDEVYQSNISVFNHATDTKIRKAIKRVIS